MNNEQHENKDKAATAGVGTSDKELNNQLNAEIIILTKAGKLEEAARLTKLRNEISAVSEQQTDANLSRGMSLGVGVGGIVFCVMGATFSWPFLLPGMAMLGFAAACMIRR